MRNPRGQIAIVVRSDGSSKIIENHQGGRRIIAEQMIIGIKKTEIRRTIFNLVAHGSTPTDWALYWEAP